MGNLASLTFRLGADIKAFQTNMKIASNQMRKIGGEMKKIGSQMSMYVTGPIAAMGATSLAAFDKQMQAEQKLSAQLRKNGKDVDATMNLYKTYASNLQKITTVGDETSLGLMQLAESMKSPNTLEATKGAIGLSKALGINLQSALKMVVLAQNGEYTMLNRYVPSLRLANTEVKKAAIMSKLYADGMEIAKTEAQTGLGPLKQLKNSIGDIAEEFGGLIAKAIKPAIEWLKSIVEKFSNLSDKGKLTVGIIASVAAAIGPLILVLGSLLSVLPAVGAALAALTGPIGLVVGAIAAIGAAFIYIYDNWQAFKERLSNWAWLRNAAIDALSGLIKISGFFLNQIAKLFGYDFVTTVTDELEKLKVPVEGVVTEFKSFGDSVSDVANEVMTSLGFLGSSGTKVFDDLSNAATNASNTINRELGPQIKFLERRVIRLKVPLDYELAPQSNPTPEPAFIKNYEEALENLRNTAELVGNSVGNVFEDMGNRILESFGLAEDGFEGFLREILATVIKLIAIMLAQSLANAIAGATSAGTATGPAAPITTPVFIATAIAGVLTAFAAIPSFATGGIVPDGFPNDSYPAWLTSGEMVIPKGRPLPTFENSPQMDIRVHGKLSGHDILIASEGASVKRARTRGY